MEKLAKECLETRRKEKERRNVNKERVGTQ